MATLASKQFHVVKGFSLWLFSVVVVFVLGGEQTSVSLQKLP